MVRDGRSLPRPTPSTLTRAVPRVSNTVGRAARAHANRPPHIWNAISLPHTYGFVRGVPNPSKSGRRSFPLSTFSVMRSTKVLSVPFLRLGEYPKKRERGCVMWNWFNCYLSGRHDYTAWCESGAMFLRCVHCGRRSAGWAVTGEGSTQAQGSTLGQRTMMSAARTPRVSPVSRGAAN
jgi:hypothetical protein